MNSFRFKIILIVSFFSILFLGCATIPDLPIELQPKNSVKNNINLDNVKTIAILNFKNLSTDSGAGQKVLGEATQELLNLERFTIVEREQVDKAIQELALMQTGLTDVKKIKEVGNFLNADALIIGEVTNYQHITENLKYDYSNDGLRLLPLPPDESDARGLKITSEKRSYPVQKYTAGISINIRIIDVSTAKVIWAKNVSRNFSLFDGEYGYRSVYTLLDNLTKLAIKDAFSELKQ